MSNNFIGPPKRDFDQLFKLAESELITMRTDAIEPALLVAICVNASSGNGFFCCSPATFREAMSTLIDRPGINPKEFILKTVPASGFRKNQNPKFEYAPRNWGHGEAIAKQIGGTATDAAIFACNWGLAQLPAWRIVEDVQPDYKLDFLQVFLGDLNVQMRELIRICTQSKLGKLDRNIEMLTMLHSQRRVASDISGKVMRDWDLARRLSHCADPIAAGYKV